VPTRFLHLAWVALAAAAPCAGASPVDDSAALTGKRVAALRVDEAPVVDGRLDEEGWALAEAASAFIQQEPHEGQPSTEASEVRFLYDSDRLYVGGTFHDAHPDGGIVNELKRDFSADDGDSVTIILDTFRDRRNAFNFMINPAGAQRDSQSYDDGRQNNADWDGVWHVKTTRFDGGWTMEMAIPFRTLRFARLEDQIWGLNIFRLIRRKNEVTSWSPVPRQFGQSKVSYAGALTGIRSVRPGRNLRIKPFLTGQMSQLPSRSRRLDGDGGVDLKYGIGSALALDLTYRTDFSQVEADDQQINLTRFSLFLPEKREFFLENQGSFRIGDIDAGSGARGSPLLPFFSRRIGVGMNQEAVPILGGARLSGKQGTYNIGLLNMQTDPLAERTGDNFTAARVSRELGNRSSIAGFYFGRESSGADPFNRVVGADVHVNVRRTVDLDAYVLRSSSPSGLDDFAGRAALNVAENLYTGHLSYTYVGPRFRNDLGFTPRHDVGLTSWEFEWNFRPSVTYRWVRTYTLGTEGDAYMDSGRQNLLSRVVRIDSSAEFADGGRFSLDFDSNHELITAPFEISSGVEIPPGVYEFRHVTPSYRSDASRWLSGEIGYQLGDFWSGTIRGINSGLRVRANDHLAVRVNYAQNDVDLPEGRFSTELLRLRMDFSFSTRMFVNALVQYNSTSRAWVSNVRYRFIYRPLSDIFVVFNETRAPASGPNRAVIVKSTMLLAF
jgi:hypothetical protein